MRYVHYGSDKKFGEEIINPCWKKFEPKTEPFAGVVEAKFVFGAETDIDLSD